MWQIFITQSFADGAGNRIPGEQVLEGLFHLRNISSWGMFGTLLAYVAFFRLNQWFLLAQQTDKLPFRLPTLNSICRWPAVVETSRKSDADNDGEKTVEVALASEI